MMFCIYSKTEEKHEKHLRMAIKVLKEHQLYDKLRKFTFYLKKIHYLGHIVSKYDIVVDPKIIEENGRLLPRHSSGSL
jgi:hypothetical protein